MRRIIFVLLLVVLVAPAAPAAAQIQTSVVERQLAWLVDASHRLPVAETELRQHFSVAFLDAVGGPAGFNDVFANFAPLSTTRVVKRGTGSLQVVANDSFLVDLGVDSAGLLGGLRFQPYTPSPRSWSELDSRLLALAPQVSYAASVYDKGKCTPVHEVAGTEPRPLGSAFKLYVLGALERKTTDWSKNLPIREKWKSLPSGQLQDAPAGTDVTLQRHADLMISISDNTATDHLIHYVGRDAVRRQLTAFGNSVPALNNPFLTTRELFTLKGFQYPTLANAYLSLPRPLRHTMLPALAAVPRTAIQGWTGARNLDTVEWFGSALDMCRALGGLWDTHSPRVTEAMSIEDAHIGLDRMEYPTVWYKGGSEEGLLVLNYLARTTDGRTIVASVMLVSPDGVIAPESGVAALALARGGIELATS